MRKQLTLATILAISFMVSSCTKDQMQANVEVDTELLRLIRSAADTGTEDFYILPDQDDLANIPADPKNPLTAEKVELGRLIFFDTGLGKDNLYPSGEGTYSCASCHIPEAGFRPGAEQGIADGGMGFGVNGEGRFKNPDYQADEIDAQNARPLTLMNVAFVRNTFWNGQFGHDGVNLGTEDMWGVLDPASELNFEGFQGVETQNIEGLHTHRYKVDKEILDQFGYTDMFDEAFPDLPADETDRGRYSLFGASLAVSAFIRTILSTEAPFQDYLKGNKTALTYDEKQGALIFFDKEKGKCINCHYNENLGSLEFHALGVNDLDQLDVFETSDGFFRNKGRGGFTGNSDDDYKFKVPGIYNMADTPFYFHGSSKRSLTDLVEYKNDAVGENPRVAQEKISEKFEPLNLTVLEKQRLVAFLENALRDPSLTRYYPESVPSGQNCFPNFDSQSQIDQGCQ